MAIVGMVELDLGASFKRVLDLIDQRQQLRQDAQRGAWAQGCVDCARLC
jgi:hypothetical protein